MNKYLIILLFPLLPLAANAQTIYSATWDTSLGTGTTSDYIGAFSGRGVTFLDIRSFVSSNVSIGGSIGLHALYEEVSGSFVNQNRTTTGTQKRYINSLPIMFNSHYYFGEDDGSITPYIGLGIGTYVVDQRTDVGLFRVEDNGWLFGLAPEVGLLLPIAGDKALILKAKYNYAFESSSFGPYEYLNFGVGFAWY